MKLLEIAGIIETWMQVGHHNEKLLNDFINHILKYGKILTFSPYDIHALMYNEIIKN